MPNLLVHGQRSCLLALAAEHLDGHRVAATSANVNVVNVDILASHEKLVRQVEDKDDNGHREEALEEGIGAFRGRHLALSDGEGRNVERDDNDKNVEESTVEGTPDAERRLPGELLQSVASTSPCLAEAGMGNANTEPADDG